MADCFVYFCSASPNESPFVHLYISIKSALDTLVSLPAFHLQLKNVRILSQKLFFERIIYFAH